MAVFCGQCNVEFDTEELELAHVCETTGYAPTDPRSMGPNWDKIAVAAIERGADESTIEAVEAAIAEVETLAQETV
jgi:hypothetical protein